MPPSSPQSQEEYLTVLLTKKRKQTGGFSAQVTEMQELAGQLPDGWDVADIAITDRNAKVMHHIPEYQKF